MHVLSFRDSCLSLSAVLSHRSAVRCCEHVLAGFEEPPSFGACPHTLIRRYLHSQRRNQPLQLSLRYSPPNTS
jgi:hypothetical protein